MLVVYLYRGVYLQDFQTRQIYIEQRLRNHLQFRGHVYVTETENNINHYLHFVVMARVFLLHLKERLVLTIYTSEYVIH